jgi:hypothetical protein
VLADLSPRIPLDAKGAAHDEVLADLEAAAFAAVDHELVSFAVEPVCGVASRAHGPQ